MFTSFLDRAKNMAAKAVTEPLTLTLDESLLNTLLEKLVTDAGGPIQGLKLVFYDGGFKARGQVIQNTVSANVEADFILEKLEISPAQQILVLRRCGELAIEGENWWSKIAVMVVEVIVSGLLRDSMMGRFVGNVDAIAVNDPEVAVDLGRLGMADKLIEAVVQKWLADNAAAKVILKNLTGKGGNFLTNRVSLTDARCTATGLQLNVKLGDRN